MSPEEAVAWVGKNAGMIRGRTRKFLPFVPYDREDFMQDAYEAALLAARVAAKTDLPFVPCFWVTLKNRISEVTPYPDSKRHAGSASPPVTLCATADFFEWEEDAPERMGLIDLDLLFEKVSDHLTVVERRILSLALGLEGGRMGIKEVARELNCTPANVRQALNRSYRRLARLVEAGDLEIQMKDVEIKEVCEVPQGQRRVGLALEQSGLVEKEMTLGQRIRMIRGKRTMANFVKGYGICPNTLMNYEADRRKPDADFLARLCEKEGVEPNWLLGFGDGEAGEIAYKRHILEMVAAEAVRKATFQVGPKMGKLLTLAYERAASANAGKRQIEDIVTDLLEFLDGGEKKCRASSAGAGDELAQIAC